MSILELPDVLIGVIFTFVGCGNFRYVSSTCKRFQYIYQDVHTRKKNKKKQNKMQKKLGNSNSGNDFENNDDIKLTSIQSAAESIRKSQIYLSEELYFSQEGKLEKLVIAAARAQNLCVLKYATEQPKGLIRIQANYDICQCLASQGLLESLKLLRNIGCPWDSRSCFISADHNGHFDVAQWIKENE